MCVCIVYAYSLCNVYAVLMCYIWVCVCVHVYICACEHVLNVCACAHMYMCTCVCTCTNMDQRMCSKVTVWLPQKENGWDQEIRSDVGTFSVPPTAP